MLFSRRERLGSPWFLVGGIPVAHLFGFLCCDFCLRVLLCVLGFVGLYGLSMLDCFFLRLFSLNNRNRKQIKNEESRDTV